MLGTSEWRAASRLLPVSTHRCDSASFARVTVVVLGARGAGANAGKKQEFTFDGGDETGGDIELPKRDPYQTEESTLDRAARHFKSGLFGVLYVST